MTKELSELSLEELWRLFPIYLTEHKDCWKDWYREEAASIAALFPLNGARLTHIGSTAIEGIWAKPTIDILLEITSNVPMDKVTELLLDCGYTCMCDDGNRVDFCKGYTKFGFSERVFHLHLRFFGDNDEIYFRDYMNDNPPLAKKYEELKLSLWRKFEFDRDGYTEAKGEFIKEQTQSAKILYGKRYG